MNYLKVGLKIFFINVLTTYRTVLILKLILWFDDKASNRGDMH